MRPTCLRQSCLMPSVSVLSVLVIPAPFHSQRYPGSELGRQATEDLMSCFMEQCGKNLLEWYPVIMESRT